MVVVGCTCYGLGEWLVPIMERPGWRGVGGGDIAAVDHGGIK